MFTKGIILSEADYRSLWVDFMEILRERIKELDEEERAILMEDRDELEEWVKERVMEMFDAVLDDYDAEEAVVFLKGDCNYVPNSEEFFYLSYKDGRIDRVIKELEQELKRGIKESVRRFRLK
jgi:hypothetical protein